MHRSSPHPPNLVESRLYVCVRKFARRACRHERESTSAGIKTNSIGKFIHRNRVTRSRKSCAV